MRSRAPRRQSANRPLPKTIEMVDDDMASVLRQKTGAERLAIAFGLFESARKMLSNVLRSEHPEWTAEELEREVARRMSARGDS